MSTYKWLIAGFGVAALSLAALLYADAGRGIAHPPGTACEACHLAVPSVDQDQVPKLVSSQELLCVGCHAPAIEVSHPSGFTPKRSLPTEYPLDWKGDLTCSTCHVTHGKEPGLLRGKKRGKDFCLTCHDQTFFRSMKDAGTSMVISGHLDVRRGRSTVDIDAHSLHCLGCHAGSHSDGGSVSIGSNGVLRHASGAAPHPIGRSYREASKKGGFHPENQLAQKKILLSGGRISCISCHEAYKKEHGTLVVSNERSTLCLSCHAK